MGLQFPRGLSQKKLLLIWIGMCVVFLTTIAGTVALLANSKESTSQMPSQQEDSDVIALPEPLPDNTQSLTVLLLGYGGPGHQGGYLTDVLQVVHLDFDTQKISLISLPRDAYVRLPNGKEAKINAAFTLGDDPDKPIQSGGEVAKRMVEQVLGIPIDYFIAVDFVGFQRTIGGWLGGIEVTVHETLDDPWYPVRGKELDTCGMTPEEVATVSVQYSGFELEKQFPCRYEHVYFEPGTYTMHGDEALKYVRSRHGSAAGDFSRSTRQHEVLTAIKDKVLTLQALQSAPAFFETAVQQVTTDLSVSTVTELTPLLQHGIQFPEHSIVLSTDTVFTTSKSPTGQFILVPKAGVNNWSGVHQYIQEELEK